MHTEYLAKFSKDINRIKSAKTKKAILDCILQVKSANSIKEINNLKPLIGHKGAYRIRLGQYRLGIFIEGDIVQLARIAHRKDIYKLFP